jgi:hypothetical protein
MDTLTFLTMTSGHSQPSPLSEAQFALPALRPLVLAGGGPVPGQRAYTFQVTSIEGGAVFSVHDGALILAFCGVAYAPAAAEQVWDNLTQAHLTTYELVVQKLGFNTPDNWLASPEQPATLPWLAVTLQPGLLLRPSAASWLADFERCVAWTIIELRDFFEVNG